MTQSCRTRWDIPVYIERIESPSKLPYKCLGNCGTRLTWLYHELAHSVGFMLFQFIVLASLLLGGRISFMACAHFGVDEIWFKTIIESKQLISKTPLFIL